MRKLTRPVLRGGNGGNAISLTRPWKKGLTYGTIQVDLEKRQVVQLLADRSVETSKTWLRKHPEIDLVSCDRGKIFREAATLGAPQAKQTVDRFHLFVRRIGACLDSFRRKEGLRAKDP